MVCANSAVSGRKEAVNPRSAMPTRLFMVRVISFIGCISGSLVGREMVLWPGGSEGKVSYSCRAKRPLLVLRVLLSGDGTDVSPVSDIAQSNAASTDPADAPSRNAGDEGVVGVRPW